jgi:hypothetical protein
MKESNVCLQEDNQESYAAMRCSGTGGATNGLPNEHIPHANRAAEQQQLN